MSADHPVTQIHLDQLDLAATDGIAEKLAALLGQWINIEDSGQGANIFLKGEMGAGKTTLAQGIVRRLCGVEHVSSPTYSVINPYQLSGSACKRFLYHIDCFRLAGAGHLIALGADDLDSGQHVLLVEWAEKALEALPAADLIIDIRIRKMDETAKEPLRTIVIQAMNHTAARYVTEAGFR